MDFKSLNQIINQFFEDSSIQELVLRFNEDVEVSPEEFKELIGVGELISGFIENGIIEDIYEYWEEGRKYVKLFIMYYKSGEKYYIIELQLWREIKS